jgi:hypothetical protein
MRSVFAFSYFLILLVHGTGWPLQGTLVSGLGYQRYSFWHQLHGCWISWNGCLCLGIPFWLAFQMFVGGGGNGAVICDRIANTLYGDISSEGHFFSAEYHLEQ